MAAGTAAKNGNDVILFERNDKVGRKIMITGKGRCTVTTATFDAKSLIDNVPRNGRFLYSAFSEFSARDTMDFFEELDVYKRQDERANIKKSLIPQESRDLYVCV